MATDVKAERNVSVTEDWRNIDEIDERRERKRERLSRLEKIRNAFKY